MLPSCGLHRQLRQTRHLQRRNNITDVLAAVEKDLVRARFLEVLRADFRRGYVSGDREDRCLIAGAVVQAVNEMARELHSGRPAI